MCLRVAFITLVKRQGALILDDFGKAVDNAVIVGCLFALGLETNLDNLKGLHDHNLPPS
jgi:hypothetical protein